jgi:hypothetical protein
MKTDGLGGDNPGDGLGCDLMPQESLRLIPAIRSVFGCAKGVASRGPQHEFDGTVETSQGAREALGLLGQHLRVIKGVTQPDGLVDLPGINTHGSGIRSGISAEQGPSDRPLVPGFPGQGLTEPEVEVEGRVQAGTRLEWRVGFREGQRRQESTEAGATDHHRTRGADPGIEHLAGGVDEVLRCVPPVSGAEFLVVSTEAVGPTVVDPKDRPSAVDQELGLRWGVA